MMSAKQIVRHAKDWGQDLIQKRSYKNYYIAGTAAVVITAAAAEFLRRRAIKRKAAKAELPLMPKMQEGRQVIDISPKRSTAA